MIDRQWEEGGGMKQCIYMPGPGMMLTLSLEFFAHLTERPLKSNPDHHIFVKLHE